MKLYLAVTADEYELPIAVEETCAELARRFGITNASLLSTLSHGDSTGRYSGHKFIRIEVEDDEDRTGKDNGVY
jgi:hypothetical protein